MTAPRAATGRPNILWISTHDINPHLSCYAGVHPGAEQARTPHLDRLASEGMRFDRAFAAAPVCGPSRSAIMTGCHPAAIGTMHMRTKAVLPPDVRLFTEYLREAGYHATNNRFTDFQTSVPASAFDDCSATAHWRDRPSTDTPFFAAFHGLVTHESQLYGDDDEFAARIPHVAPHERHDPAGVELPPYHPDTPAFRTAWARYHDLITEMDHQVGELLAQLDEDGLTDSTIVVFWSDHGLGMPRAKRWLNDSGLHVPLVVRWPGRVPAGSVHTDPVHLMDLAPTMLEVCGVDVPASMHGVPLLTRDGTVVEHPHDYVFAGRDRLIEIEDRSRSARDDRYRYVRHFHPDRSPMPHCEYTDALDTWRDLRRLASAEAAQRAVGEPRSLLTPGQRVVVAQHKPAAEELYDLAEDPHELHNLASDPAHGGTLARFRAAVEGWLEACGDLAEQDEDDLAASWRPWGRWEVVEPPAPGAGGALVSATPGARVVWTVDQPVDGAAAPNSAVEEAVGMPAQDGRHWLLLCAATPPPEDVPVWLKACRPGFRDSVEIVSGAPAGSAAAPSRGGG
ncbi:sulfatase [Pseudonocardia nematodicida]|uniref:Sulfatase n=1 Tax=Pseudonocardia nematodicida TaxID=1206997 RepID=A0ABV1KHK3_9PSEU